MRTATDKRKKSDIKIRRGRIPQRIFLVWVEKVLQVHFHAAVIELPVIFPGHTHYAAWVSDRNTA